MAKFNGVVFLGLVLFCFVFVVVFVFAAGIDLVNLISPGNNSWTSSDNDSIEFIFNYMGENATASCELLIGGVGFGVDASVLNNTNTTMYANNSISDGSYNWSVNCINGSVTYLASNFSLNVDTTSPSVSLIYPTATNYSSISTLNFSAVDDNLESCWYSVNNSVNVTTSCSANVTGLLATEGSNTWTVYTNDSAGNENSSFVVFTYDITSPSVSLIYPTATNYSSISTLNFSAVDDNLESCWYSVNSSVNVTTSCSANVTGLVSIEGLNTWTVYANDSVGNENSSSVSLLLILLVR